MAIKLLVCAATRIELMTFQPILKTPRSDRTYVLSESKEAELVVTGVGIPCTLLNLPPLLAALKPDLVLNIGIAGAYPNSGLKIGDIAMARSETIGDIGFELNEEPGFQSVSSAPFGTFYRKLPMALSPTFRFQPANYGFLEIDACTVNTCTGTAHTGLMRERMFGVGMESMEGAAVALACDATKIPVCEVRAISNMASDRDMRPANIGIALDRLGEYLGACRRREGI